MSPGTLPWELAASLEQLSETLKQAKYPDASQAASKIFEQLHQPHLTADGIINRTKSQLVLVLFKQLQPLVEEIANYDEKIEHLFVNILFSSCSPTLTNHLTTCYATFFRRAD